MKVFKKVVNTGINVELGEPSQVHHFKKHIKKYIALVGSILAVAVYFRDVILNLLNP